jgi:predicted DNA-binding transcriptional regulator YafY
VTPDRFFSLLLTLQSRETTTTADLAAQVGVSVRTVLRDLQWLQEAGFPLLIRRGRWGGVTLLPGGTLDTSRLTSSERDHLALHGLDDRQREQLGAAAGTRRAHQKMRSTLGLSNTDVLPATWRVIDPYGLLAKAGRWYLVADSAGRPHLHALERIVGWEPMRAARRMRPDVTLESVASELTAHWENPEALQIHAELDSSQLSRARRILGRRLTIRGTAGAQRVRITVTGRELEDVRLLLQFGDSVTVTGPAEARERIRQLAAQILQTYS